MIRDIVLIDEDLCNGCGACVPACAEGAIKIVDGKARIVSENLCDGLGACLGHCPQGAIRIERREAEAFDEEAVHRHLAGAERPADSAHAGTAHVATAEQADPPGSAKVAPTNNRGQSGCPSGRFARFERRLAEQAGQPDGGGASSGGGQASELTHWPVQLRLLSPIAPVLKGARLLVTADCVPVAFGGFHAELLRDHAVVMACPKLDDPSGYIEKLTEMIRRNELKEITVARMEVPCCAGLLHMVLEARRLAVSDVPVEDVTISTRGEVLSRRSLSAESYVPGNGGLAGCPSRGVH
jgi:NAD-dependent dihydropyrimidine dehydrogenase PreA subunit